MPVKHISRIGEEIQTLRDVTELSPHTLTLCLHNNLLRSLASISSFTGIVDLNASLNHIASTDGLSSLSRLTSLNLSSNLLQRGANLNGLSRLKTLQLQFNQISTSSGLSSLSRHATCLAYLDLRGNRFNAYHEMELLKGLSGLATLLVDHAAAQSLLPPEPLPAPGAFHVRLPV